MTLTNETNSAHLCNLGSCDISMCLANSGGQWLLSAKHPNRRIVQLWGHKPQYFCYYRWQNICALPYAYTGNQFFQSWPLINYPLTLAKLGLCI